MPLLSYFFFGLGWPWVGEFDGFIIIFICFPTYIAEHPTSFSVSVFAVAVPFWWKLRSWWTYLLQSPCRQANTEEREKSDDNVTLWFQAQTSRVSTAKKHPVDTKFPRSLCPNMSEHCLHCKKASHSYTNYKYFVCRENGCIYKGVKKLAFVLLFCYFGSIS